MKNLISHLKISRPGLWFPTLWLYVLPLSLGSEFWQSPIFWLGLFFVAFPLNYFVYAVNDYGDREADSLNERKGNFLFGAKEDAHTLKNATIISSVLLLIFMVVFASTSGWKMYPLFLSIFVFNLIYNFKPFRIKSIPPFELMIQVGYILTALFSVVLNDTEQIPWQTFIYLTFFCFKAHLTGEIMDIIPDRLANKKTTASLLGAQKAKLLLLVFLIIETSILIYWFEAYLLAAALGAFAVWIVLDAFVIYKNRSYILKEMKLFGYLMNAVGFGSMIWILWTGKLMTTI